MKTHVFSWVRHIFIDLPWGFVGTIGRRRWCGIDIKNGSHLAFLQLAASFFFVYGTGFFFFFFFIFLITTRCFFFLSFLMSGCCDFSSLYIFFSFDLSIWCWPTTRPVSRLFSSIHMCHLIILYFGHYSGYAFSLSPHLLSANFSVV